MTRRIAVITGTRSEYGLLKPVMEALQERDNVEAGFIATGMHLQEKYGRTIEEIERDGFPVWEQVEAYRRLPGPDDIDRLIRFYEQIRERTCPVSFVFVKADRPGYFDIFRLSARIFLEHHNQAKVRITERGKVVGVTGTPQKQLEALCWVPRWASHIGCIQGCLNVLGIDVSDAWLYGATGHAFVLNIVPTLCPSGPTDWDTRPFLELGRNLGYEVESVDAYCPNQGRDLAEAQQRAWELVTSSIDEGLPCYGWELDIPEYAVIYGYNETGYYISGPGCDEGKGPIPKADPGRSEIGQVLVACVKPTTPADDRKVVRNALAYAMEIGHNRRKWTDGQGGLKGYDYWAGAMRTSRAGRFGLGYNAAVWAECRRYAVAFLKEAKDRLDSDLTSLFDKAIDHYEVVAGHLKTVSDTYPFLHCDHEPAGADDHAEATAVVLKQARNAEAAGLDSLARILGRLDA